MAGSTPWWRARAATSTPNAPAAPNPWPSADLGAVTASPGCPPNTARRARASATSPWGVAVAWATKASTSPGATPASRNARPMAAAAPRPSGWGAATWWASPALPPPATTASTRAPRATRPVEPLQHEDGRPLRRHHPVPAHVVGAAGRRRVGARRRQRPRVDQRPQQQGRQGAVGGTRQHHLGVPPLQHPQPVDHRLHAGRARPHAAQDRARRPQDDRRLAGGHVGPVDGHEEGADPVGTGGRGTGRALGLDQPAGAGVDHHAQPVAGVAGEPGVGQGHDRRRHRELAEPAHAPGRLAVDIVLGPEPPGPAHDLAAGPAQLLGRRLQPRVAGQQPGPGGGRVTQGGDGADPGDGDRGPCPSPVPIHRDRHRTGVRQRRATATSRRMR